jgi:A/G-specific adenine glycosylase
MLQQTTTQAVIPFYERFLKRFPTVQTLAKAKIEDVYEMWSGLGYYSRARNLHKASQVLAKKFPQTAGELLELPGFGPYTSRSVASLAFSESVGVLDGNVIRVLTRVHDLDYDWWKTAERRELQRLADAWVKGLPSEEMNQALMELGATVCVPQNPACLLCPLNKICEARANATIALRPRKRPRRQREVWAWQVQIIEKKGKILICRNPTVPFMKGQWLLPGEAKLVKKMPKQFHFRHSVTHHDIFVTLQPASSKLDEVTFSDRKWISSSELHRHVPASLVQKAYQMHQRR